MSVENVLEGVLFVVAMNTGVNLLSPRSADRDASFLTMLRDHRLPVTAVVITVGLCVGSLLEVFWPGALDALRDDSSGQWWRLFTAPFVQDGIAGAVFNIVTAAIILALAGWYWGRLITAGIWLLGAWAPIGKVAGLVGYHVSAHNATAYTAGSSGATYFTAGTLCAALLLSSLGRERLLGLVGPAIALVMWITLNDGHGVVFFEGFVLGLALCCLVRGLHLQTQFQPSNDPRLKDGVAL
jgi:Rhomboid family